MLAIERSADLILQLDVRMVEPAMPAAAALDASKLAASYTPLNVYAWILPVLGFIGTASGMASSIGGFSAALQGRQGQIEALANELGQKVIPGLSGAFATTMVLTSAFGSIADMAGVGSALLTCPDDPISDLIKGFDWEREARIFRPAVVDRTVARGSHKSGTREPAQRMSSQRRRDFT
jgi:hypothetical protein